MQLAEWIVDVKYKEKLNIRVSDNLAREIQRLERFSIRQFGEVWCTNFTKRLSKLVNNAFQLMENPTGILYEVDKIMGTNEQVFSLVGPSRHLERIEYGSIAIILNQKVCTFCYHECCVFILCILRLWLILISQ